MTTRRRRLMAYRVLSLCLTVAVCFGQPRQASKPDSEANDPFSMDLDSLSNVKVTTASKFSEKLSDAPSVMSVVTSDELKRFGGMTLREILERVAGLTSSSGAFTDRSIMAVRGDQTRPDGGHLLFLINGRPTREVLEGGMGSDILESFPVDVLERIEVIKGPGSVLYGSDAYSGVINLITQKAGGNGFSISTAGGGGGALAESAKILFQRGELKLIAAGQYHGEPQWNTTYRSLNASDPTSPAFGTTTAQNVTLDSHGTGGYLGIDYQGLKFMSSFTEWDAPSFAGGTLAQTRWKRGFADVGYGLKASGKWQMNFNLTYTRISLGMSAYPYVESGSNETVLEWTNFVTLSDKDRLTFGALFNHVAGKGTYFGVSPALVVSEGSRSGMGFYAQQEHKLTDDLKLVGGFQANSSGNMGLDVVPRAGIVWNPASHITVKALYGSAFRAPSLNELSLNYPSIKGNPKLAPEKVGTLDVGVTFQSKRLQAGIDYFHSRQTRQIAIGMNSYPLLQYVNNPGAATFQGVEAEVKYYLRRDWFLTGSLLYQVNGGGTTNSPLTPIPNLGGQAGISYLAENGLTASVFDVYRGRPDGYMATLNPPPDAHHSVNAHLRFDLSKHWLKENKSGFALFAHVDNLTNRQVWLPDFGYGIADTIPVRQGRTVYFGLEVWLKHE